MQGCVEHRQSIIPSNGDRITQEIMHDKYVLIGGMKI